MQERKAANNAPLMEKRVRKPQQRVSCSVKLLGKSYLCVSITSIHEALLHIGVLPYRSALRAAHPSFSDDKTEQGSTF